MKNRLVAVLTLVLCVLIFAGCKQIAYPLPESGISPGIPSEKPSPEDSRSFIEALNNQLLSDIESVMNGKDVDGLYPIDTPSSSSAKRSSRTGEDVYTVFFGFDRYVIENYGEITKGTFSVEFKGSSTVDGVSTTFSSVASTMNLSDLEVSKADSNTPETISISNLTGPSKAIIVTDNETQKVTVTNLKNSMSITQSITADTSCSPKDVSALLDKSMRNVSPFSRMYSIKGLKVSENQIDI